MQLIDTLSALRQARPKWPGSVGFVPTMGALHEGHASLVRASVAENETTIVSIFVNPTQFGPNEDFGKYPRTLERDMELVKSLGANVVFAPASDAIYPKHTRIHFQIEQLDDVLCGASRPGHMNGVLQIVSILFNLVQPDKAYFGLKDYQQQLIIRRLVEELHFPLQIVPCPIVRESDGLAMSSRNRYLSPEERRQALALSHTLTELKALRGTWKSAQAARSHAIDMLSQQPGIVLDYMEVLDGRDLSPLTEISDSHHPIAFVAAFLGKTRLIDNMPLWEYPPVLPTSAS